MTKLVSQLITAAEKHAAYSRTVHELSNLPTDTALDVGIYPGDAKKIARVAVYGK
ncbi:MAG: hypothetical protein HKN63_10270 [Rhodobacteraceae bacterium]|nr:hypothetical protein [Paracoccaceae bacterium]